MTVTIIPRPDRECVDCGTPLEREEREAGWVLCRTCREVAYLEAVAEEMELDRLGEAVPALPPDEIEEYLAAEGIPLEGHGSETD